MLKLGEYSALKQYQIRKELPEFATVKNLEKVKKTHSYYHDNYHIWNNPNQTCKKNYTFFHKQNDSNENWIKQMKE